ncbi:hypothetical protein B0J11DRAFT_581126 [Dendryphion nanum]|uniref:Subtelomeric hrmA-associated cluster protein AFUB-079030/YDR124W-like helical bundle domain-containing protein n=1 Tax=Dendryphion nanum TaxID=256645 RepID=A0A9P9DNH4_9PLEO|nr:hypothetical protein B0J11DRAFT_581126 [Dendryphion nanum]
MARETVSKIRCTAQKGHATRSSGRNNVPRENDTLPLLISSEESDDDIHGGKKNNDHSKGSTLKSHHDFNQSSAPQPIGHIAVYRVGDEYKFKLPAGLEYMQLLVREEPRSESRTESHLPALAERNSIKGYAVTKAKKRGPQQSKRRRSISEGDGEDGEVFIQTVSSECFHIGDESAMRFFCERRLGELTLKPLRKIVAEWLKIVAPNRRRKFGKYHKKLPGDMPSTATPPWWPKDVIYTEPAHLVGTDLIKVAIVIMFLHRYTDPDTDRLRINWTSKLRDEAVHSLKTTPVEDFTSGKLDNDYNNQMKARALEQIVPDLFDTAQCYEDHVAMYNQYDGQISDNPESKRGKQHTWSSMKRPLRSQVSKAKSGSETALKRVRLSNDRSISVESTTAVKADEPTGSTSESASPYFGPSLSDATTRYIASGVKMHGQSRSNISLPPQNQEQNVPRYSTPISFPSMSSAGSSVFSPDAPAPMIQPTHGLSLQASSRHLPSTTDHKYRNFDLPPYSVLHPCYAEMIQIRRNQENSLAAQPYYHRLQNGSILKTESYPPFDALQPTGPPPFSTTISQSGNSTYGSDDFDVKSHSQHLSGAIDPPLMNPNVPFGSTMSFDSTTSMEDLIDFVCDQ